MEGGDRGWGLGWALLRPGRFSEGPGRTIHLKTALSGLSSSNNRVSKLRLMTMTMTVSRRDILENQEEEFRFGRPPNSPCHSWSRQARASGCVSCHGGALVSRSIFNVALFRLFEEVSCVWYSIYVQHAWGRVGSINLHQGLSLVLTQRVHSLGCVETLLITFFRIQFEDTCFSAGGNSSQS